MPRAGLGILPAVAQPSVPVPHRPAAPEALPTGTALPATGRALPQKPERLVELLLDLRQAYALQASQRMVDERRAAQVPLLAAFAAFFEAVDATPDAETTLDELYFGAGRRGRTSRRADDAFDSAVALYPDAVEVLGLSPPLTHDRLKTAYRAAALAHHPDRGGDMATMQLIVAAHVALHDVLTAPLLSDATDHTLDLPGMTARTYVREARAAWLASAFDVYDIDAAVAAYRGLLSSGDEDAVWKKHEDALLNSLPRLARLLAAAGRPDDAELLHGRWLARVNARTRRWRENRGITNASMEKLREQIDQGTAQRHLPVTRHHRVIAENLYHAGLLTKATYRKHLKQEAEVQQRVDAMTERLRAYAASPGFLQIATDGPLEPDAPDAVAPHPGYTDDLGALSDAQRRAYARAFSDATDWRLVRAYELVRIRSLVRALATEEDPLVLLRVMREAELLEAANRADQPRDFTAALCKGLIDLARHLASLSPADRATTQRAIAVEERRKNSFGGRSPLYPRWFERV